MNELTRANQHQERNYETGGLVRLKANENKTAIKVADGVYSVSKYAEQPLTKQGKAEVIVNLHSAYPDMQKSYVNMVIRMFEINGFSDQRALDSVIHVISTCQYKLPTIANFISFNQECRLYSWHQMTNMVAKHEAVWSDYTMVKVDFQEKPLYISNKDYPNSKLEKYVGHKKLDQETKTRTPEEIEEDFKRMLEDMKQNFLRTNYLKGFDSIYGAIYETYKDEKEIEYKDQEILAIEKKQFKNDLNMKRFHSSISDEELIKRGRGKVLFKSLCMDNYMFSEKK